MENTRDQLLRLLNKSEWTNEEKQWLLHYLEETEGEELNDLMQMQFQRDQSGMNAELDLPKDVLEQIHERIGVQKRTGAIVGRIRAYRILSAAAVIGLLLFASYLLFTKGTKQEFAQQRSKKEVTKNDVLPGGNNAVLTLADGSHIVLNSEQNGELVQQGGTKVLKLDGTLTYAPSDSGISTVVYNTISTPRGGQYQIVLADGSSVWLNAASSLRFPTSFTGRERRVEITGEAYFEVAKKKDKPFVVSVNGSEVQVLGTHFNIMAYEDETTLKTTLLEGAVKFSKGTQAVVLKPGQQSQLKENGDINVQSGVDVERVVSWKNGYFDFDGTDIQTVTKQLARWYDIEVVVTRRIEDRFYAEIPRNTKLSDALRALELTGKVQFKLEGRKVTVKP
ncbi:MAG TPA: FecR domain-containing protein [Flavisolibacter sp.]|jgi:hypothetical protein|nr:FecR domain-containing protein [Flavisolibacter sp.]